MVAAGFDFRGAINVDLYGALTAVIATTREGRPVFGGLGVCRRNQDSPGCKRRKVVL